MAEVNKNINLGYSQDLALSPGPSQILSRSHFLHGCEIKSGRCLGMRLVRTMVTPSFKVSVCFRAILLGLILE